MIDLGRRCNSELVAARPGNKLKLWIVPRTAHVALQKVGLDQAATDRGPDRRREVAYSETEKRDC